MSKKQGSLQENGRFSAKRKSAAVLRLLRGEDLDLLSREYKVTAAKLSQWRDAFLSGGQAGLPKGADAPDGQIEKLQAKVGELTMANDLLEHKIDRLEQGLPLPARRLKPCVEPIRSPPVSAMGSNGSVASGKCRARRSMPTDTGRTGRDPSTPTRLKSGGRWARARTRCWSNRSARC